MSNLAVNQVTADSWFSKAGMKYVPIHTWVNIDASGGTPTVRGSANISSITDNAAGDFTLNFAKTLADANYGIAFGISCVSNYVAALHTTSGVSAPTLKTATAVRVTTNAGTGNVDPSNMSVVIVGG